MLKLNNSNFSVSKPGLLKPIFLKFLFQQNLGIILVFSILSIVWMTLLPCIVAMVTNVGDDQALYFAALFDELYKGQAVLFTLLLFLFTARKIVQMVNNGDLAYIFCSRTSRQEIVFTQWFMLMILVLGNIFVNSIIVLGFGYWSEAFTSLILQVLVTNIFLVAVCVFFTCLFNKQAYYIFAVGGIFIFFFIFNLLAGMGKMLENAGVGGVHWMTYFKYFTILTFFNCFISGVDITTMSHEAYSNNWLATGIADAIIVAISGVLVTLAGVIYKNKDLPI